MNLEIDIILIQKGGKRWVIYKDEVEESSKIPSEWHQWIHFLIKHQSPTKDNPT